MQRFCTTLWRHLIQEACSQDVGCLIHFILLPNPVLWHNFIKKVVASNISGKLLWWDLRFYANKFGFIQCITRKWQQLPAIKLIFPCEHLPLRRHAILMKKIHITVNNIPTGTINAPIIGSYDRKQLKWRTKYNALKSDFTLLQFYNFT